MIVKNRWCLTLDGRAVKAGHPEANSLYAHTGSHIDDNEAKRLGIYDDEAEPMAIVEAPANKAVKPTTKEAPKAKKG